MIEVPKPGMEARVDVTSSKSSGSWFARAWVLMALLLIAGGVAIVWFSLTTIYRPASNPAAQKLLPAERIDAPTGLLDGFNVDPPRREERERA